MKLERVTASELIESAANCHGCDWEGVGRNALGIAARHHDATGHHVTIRVVRDVTYGVAGPAIPGQLDLEEELAKL